MKNPRVCDAGAGPSKHAELATPSVLFIQDKNAAPLRPAAPIHGETAGTSAAPMHGEDSGLSMLP